MSMRGGGPSAWQGVRSLRRDRTILEHRIKKGTLPRVLEFARPYQRILIIFLAAVVLDAVVSSVAPLLLREIIDVGIKDRRGGLVAGLSMITVTLAIGDAGLSLVRAADLVGHRRGTDLRPAREGLRPHPAHAHRLLLAHPDRRADQSAQQRRDRRPAGLHRPVLQRRGQLHPGRRSSSARCSS